MQTNTSYIKAIAFIICILLQTTHLDARGGGHGGGGHGGSHSSGGQRHEGHGGGNHGNYGHGGYGRGGYGYGTGLGVGLGVGIGTGLALDNGYVEYSEDTYDNEPIIVED